MNRGAKSKTKTIKKKRMKQKWTGKCASNLERMNLNKKQPTALGMIINLHTGSNGRAQRRKLGQNRATQNTTKATELGRERLTVSIAPCVSSEKLQQNSAQQRSLHKKLKRSTKAQKSDKKSINKKI